MSKVIVIGAGINGLVAAHSLNRAGYSVTLLERKDRIGGACALDWFEHEGRRIPYPSGASVLGMMQDFLFRETGLERKLEVYRPRHGSLVYFPGDATAPRLDDSDDLRDRWKETGDGDAYRRDKARVCRFLSDGFRAGRPPRWHEAIEALGEPMVDRWIRGDARSLLDHYFTSDRMKIFRAMAVTESGPVPLSERGSAFSLPLMSSGTVLEGDWGFVKGGLWQLPVALGECLSERGVEILTSARVDAIDADARRVTYSRGDAKEHARAEAIFLATDPLTAARLTGDPDLFSSARAKRYLGSSGKLVLFFREPVVWRHGDGEEDFDAAFRFFYAVDLLSDFERSNEAVRGGRVDFSPSCYQVYCEGAAMRKMGWDEGYDYLSVFFKDMGLTRRGSELSGVKRTVETAILDRIANPEAFVGAVLRTPRDLKEEFFFPEGNIDHLELCGGQTFLARTFSSDPSASFYRLVHLERIYYCGAGSYPCGSVAGTAGHLAAREFLSS